MSALRPSIQLLLLLLLGAGTGASALAQPSLPLDPAKAVTQYVFKSWTTQEGLPMNRLTTLLQTSDGYIWLGTQEGLVRFDGFDFHVFDSRNSALRSHDVAALAEDAEGNLWIGTSNDGLARYRYGRFDAYTRADGLVSDQVHALLVDSEERLWIGTQEGLNVLDGDVLRTISSPNDLLDHPIVSLVQDDEGTVWVGTLGAGVVRWKDGRFSAAEINAHLPSREVTALDASGDVLRVGTKDGLVIAHDKAVRTLTKDDGLPGNAVRAVLQDAAGSLWIGTELGGLSRVAGDKISTFSEETVSSTWGLIEDFEGNLWAATQSTGLVRLQNGKFTNFTTTEGLGSNKVYSVVEDTSGDVWIATVGGGVSRIREGEIRNFGVDDGLPTNDFYSLYAARDGSVWIGTVGAGLVHYRNGSFRRYTREDGLPDETIYSIFEDSRGVLWFGTYKAGLVRFDGRDFVTYTTDDGLTHNAVTAFAEGPDGYLWVGTFLGGVNLLKDGVVIHTYTSRTGLPGDFVTSLYHDDRGAVWIATQEGGLSRLKDGQLATVSTEHGLFNDSILQILEDDAGNLWLSSNRGLFRVPKTRVEAVMSGTALSFESTVYDRSDGLLTTEFNGGTQPAGWKDSRGRLWFVSNRGVVVVDPEHIPVNTKAPPAVIENVFATGESVRRDTAVVLAPGRNKLEIDFVGLSYVASEEVVYRYRLDGVDSEWVDAGTRRQAFYTNLPPGSYTFHVTARNADGVWSEEAATFSFYLRPFFYQTVWFFALMALLLVMGGVMMYKLRVRHLTERQRELEQIVDDRTRDLREEKEKVEKAKAVIEEQADQLRELDRVKTRFFGNISHEFRTPLTLNIGPLENALTGLYGPVPDVLNKQLQIMLRNARRLLRLINQLLDLSKLESGKMELRRKRIDIVQFVEGVVLSFTAFTEKNRIRLNFQSDAETQPVSFDPEAMEKVFFNLLSNAVKFTPGGGSIDVYVAGDAGAESVAIQVRDTGAGIPEKDLPHIFDRFHQAEGSTSTVQQGTGIGLALVKELVELHGGAISVESVAGEGTEFTIRIPIGGDEEPLADTEDESGHAISSGPMLEMAVLDDEDDSASVAVHSDGTAPETGSSRSGVRATILVTDDNPDIREYMIGCLKGSYDVVSAKNGLEAYEKARAIRPDLIISDVVMPRMTGYELCREIRADDELKMTPIILVTSKAAVDDKIEGLEAGADDYLPKPFNAEELFARVSNLLMLRRQQKDLQELNEVLQVRNVELKEASELKSQLLRIAAHDLKNPLNNIREFANLISEEIDTESEVGEMLELIQSSSNKMLELITQILESEALESGQLEIDKKPVDLAHAASAVVEVNRRQAERKGQKLVFDVTRAENCVVAASEEWLAEAMENLVSNAIKYSPPGKKIWITVRRTDRDVEIEVRDEGPGLSEDDKVQLFQKFQRLSARPTGGESSTGLGLSIVKQIVDLHDGRIRVESELGAGSAFIIGLDAFEAAVEA